MFDPNVGIKDAPSSDCGDGANRCEQKSREGMGWGERAKVPPPLPLSLSTSPLFSRSLTSRHAPICERLEKAMLTIKAACVWLRLQRRSCRSCEPAITFPLLYTPRSPLRLTLIFVIFALPHRSHIYSLKRNKPTIQKLGLLCISGRI